MLRVGGVGGVGGWGDCAGEVVRVCCGRALVGARWKRGCCPRLFNRLCRWGTMGASVREGD